MRKFLWAVLAASIIAMLPLICLRVSNENINKTVISAVKLADCMPASGDKGIDTGMLCESIKTSGAAAVIIEEKAVTAGNGLPDTESSVIDKLYNGGLEIVLHLEDLENSESFYARLSGLIDRYRVRNILICPELAGNSTSSSSMHGNPADTSVLSNLIINKNLTVYIMENREQIGCTKVAGLDKLIPETGYRINRAFSITSSIIGRTSADNAVYVWLRAVIDRNIRMIVVGASDFSGSECYEPGLSSLKKFHSLLLQRGFSAAPRQQQLNTVLPSFSSKIPLYINLIAAAALYLSYLSGSCKYSGGMAFCDSKQLISTKLCLKALLITAAAGALVVIVEDGIGTAFISAMVYPSLSSLLILRFLDFQKSKVRDNPFKDYAGVLLILAAVNLTGAAVVISSMPDIRHMMHLINFNLAIPAYIIPLLAFSLNFIIFRLIPSEKPAAAGLNINTSHKSLHKFLYKSLHNALHPNPQKALKFWAQAVILAAILFLYAERSGNYSLLPASGFEEEIRKLLEEVFYARPRTKEFLIGYPSLFLFVYFYRNSSSNRLLHILGLFASITGISIINSFCHGFTPAATSLARTLGGLLLGIPAGISAVLAAKWLRKKST